MVGWLIYSEQDIEKNKRYIQFYLEEGDLLGISIKIIRVEKLEFGIKDNQWFLIYNKDKTVLPDFVICRTIYPLLNKQLEYLGIKVFNNSRVAEICNDKALTYQHVARLGINIVVSKFYKNYMLKSVMEKLDGINVIKAVAGHGGNQVFLLNRHNSTIVEYNEKCQNIIEKLEGADVVIQPLTGSRHQDLRVYMIGKQIIAGVLRTATEGFKSNFSLGGEVRLYELNQEEIKLVSKITNLFDFGLVGIDFIIGDHGELIFNEIEDVVGARMLYQCTDINLVRMYLEFIIGRMSVEIN